MRTALTLAALLVAPALAATAKSATPPLSPVSARELQTLLGGQINKRATPFSAKTWSVVPLTSYQRLFAWNETALDTTAIDHTPPPPNGGWIFGQQFGPHRASRAMAIVHIAMFEAVNALYPRYRSYVGLASESGDISVDAAIAQSAHDALVWLYPSQQSRLDALLAADLQLITADPAAITAGKALGAQAAAAIIALRTNDGSDYTEPTVGVNFTPIGGVGHWAIDPVSGLTVALGAYWGSVKPFVITSATQFLPPAPPALNSQEYTKAYNQVASLGGDPNNGTPTIRTKAETLHGIFWTYDGAPNLCAPPRLYNQVARTLAFQQGLPDTEEAARYLALINTAMADAGITAWYAKWYYQYWRPITGIRYNASIVNRHTTPDPTWYPLGAQATNAQGPNFTPPFPAYPSGHATFGGALFESMRKYFPDNTAFTLVSDEYNGLNYSDSGQLMPLRPLTFKSLTAAETDNAESRVYIGVHWQFDADAGVAAGEQVADWVASHAFQPVTQTAAKR